MYCILLHIHCLYTTCMTRLQIDRHHLCTTHTLPYSTYVSHLFGCTGYYIFPTQHIPPQPKPTGGGRIPWVPWPWVGGDPEPGTYITSPIQMEPSPLIADLKTPLCESDPRSAQKSPGQWILCRCAPWSSALGWKGDEPKWTCIPELMQLRKETQNQSISEYVSRAVWYKYGFPRCNIDLFEIPSCKSTLFILGF